MIILARKTSRTANHITREQLARELASIRPDLKIKQSKDILDDLLVLIMDHVYAGDEVKLHNFGVFYPYYAKLSKNFTNAKNNKNRIDANKDYFTMKFKFSRTSKTRYSQHISVKTRAQSGTSRKKTTTRRRKRKRNKKSS